MKKVLLAGLLVSSVFFNVACDDSDLASGAIGVGVGIGLGNYYDSHHDGRYDRRHDGRYDGRYGRGGYRNCNRYRCYNSDVNMLDDSANLVATSFAQKHNIPATAGAKIEKAFSNVNQNGLASFQAIGLNEGALKSIMNRSLPNETSIRAMSQELNISEAKSQSLLQNLIAEFDQQASNGQSDYWKACQAKGQWKTPQNANCSSTSWNGCSPDTGATLCY